MGSNADVGFDYEIFEMFKDQCIAQLPAMEKKVLSLSKPDEYEENLNDLFRIFHNYKSTSKYLGLDTIYALVKKAEDVLGGLRNLQSLNDESIVEWLLKVKDQFEVWLDEMDLGVTSFSECPAALLNEIEVIQDRPKPSEIIKTLNLLYVDKDEARSQLIPKVLSKILNNVTAGSSLAALEVLEKDALPHIVMLNVGDENKVHYERILKEFPSIVIITVFDKLTRRLVVDLAKHNISHFISNPIKGDALKRELLAIAHAHFSQRRVLINNKKIYEFIQNLEPLPNTIMQIQQVCDDDELSIRDLVEVIQRDPVIVGLLLNAANSPIYGLKSGDHSIENVVAIFGKKTVKAICFGMLSSRLGEISLKAYGMNEETFTKASALRLQLISQWYKHVDNEALKVLATTAIVSNIGQLLISKEIERLGVISDFQEALSENSSVVAEEKLLHTNTFFVSSDILTYWQLDPKVIDTIRYSNDVLNAPDEIKKLAIANFIVCTLVDYKAEVLTEIPDDVFFVLSEEGLDPQPLNNALKSIQSK